MVLRENDPEVKVKGLQILAHLGAKGLSHDVAELLTTYHAGWYDQLSRALPLIEDPECAGAVRLLLGGHASVRHRAVLALQRLGCALPEDEAHLVAGFEEWNVYSERSIAAEEFIRRRGARRASLQRLLDAIDDVRVVFVGESHGDPTTHAFLIELVTALMTRHGGERLALGYETPVRDYLQPVLGYAAELGLECVALEQERPRFESTISTAMRDQEAARHARAWLAAHPGARLLIPYGQRHVSGAGHLPDRLQEPAVVVLTIGPNQGLVSLFADDPDPRNLFVEFGTDGRYFLRGCRDASRLHPHLHLLLDWLRRR